MNMFRYWIVFAVLFSSLPSFATEVTDLYRAKADLVSQSTDDKNMAIRAAMEKVLVKVAGNRELLSNPLIQKELDRHARYMTQFNFTRDNGVNKLVAAFDENRIKQLFLEHNVPLWGSLRPLVLFWVVKDDGLSRTIVSESEESILQTALKSASSESGLPIVLPLMDLTDAQNVQTSDLWGRFVEPVANASQRYSPESIAIVRVSQLNRSSAQPLTSVDWYMVDVKTQQVQSGRQFKGENESELLTQVVSNITATMAEKYALSTTSNNELMLDVTGITSLLEFVELTRFFDKLSAITQVKLVQVNGNTRRFVLSYMGTQEALFTTLSLNKNLTLQGVLQENLEAGSDEGLNEGAEHKAISTPTLDTLATDFEDEVIIPTFVWGVDFRGTE